MSRGGERGRAGRQAADGAKNVKRVTVCMEDDDHTKFKQLGGSPWLRNAVRNAELPTEAENNREDKLTP